ncbi:tyrosine-type recombinase/integrase [Alkalicaulis satelles]|uniref:tyrosine-type recombinase/integrase n=1 Tax=Alkalicaulis satelles TaxID=2609175 RepID=UPI001E325F3A|nr:site-specific integrase [Alkalicaulis satelles]
MKAQIRAGTLVMDDQTVTVREACAAYMESAAVKTLEPSTWNQYEQHVRVHISPRLGELLLTHLSERRVYEFIDSLTAEASAVMARKVLATLKRIITDAQRRGQVGRNVIIDKQIRVCGASQFQKRLPERRELQRLLAASDPDTRVLFLTAMLTGLRRGELRALSWDDVRFEERVIRVRRSARETGTIKATKTRKGHRDIPMGANLIHELKAWKLRCPTGPAQLVFPNGAGRVESGSNIWNRRFVPAMKAAGLVDQEGKPVFRFHDLRHAAAALFIEQGMGPKRIQDLMGHASIQMTFDTYGYLFRDDDRDAQAAEGVAARLLGSG